MHPRARLIRELQRHLLGPREGPLELLAPEREPRDEYVTGVLECADTEEVQPDLDSEVMELQGEAALHEEDESDAQAFAASGLPSLDPRREPSSIGLSFVVEASGEPGLSACVTWARYSLSEEGWQREPRGTVFTLDPSATLLDLPDDPARLVIRWVERGKGRWQVSLFLVNRLLGNRPRHRSSRLLFQPQLRVCLKDGTELVGLNHLEAEEKQGDEEERLRLLYRKLAVKARGHMCGAVWRDVDPRVEPFGWMDEQACPEQHRERFREPDVRTEFLPVTAVSAPTLGWRSEFGAPPVLEARRLAECWEHASLREALEPLLDGYATWLDELSARASELPERHQPTAAEHEGLCRESLDRMRAGLERLVQDEEARLAFCFANRAICEQASWRSPGSTFSWRPFQLGFFLQGLEGLTDASSPDRTLCDLLWFPTGGGKTEAYLGITAYVLALRRLKRPGFDGTGVISRYTLRLLSIQQFRRALGLVTACEVLRVTAHGALHGWRPPGCTRDQDWLWGRHRFSAGLWVGGGVTPNRLEKTGFPVQPGALDNLVHRQVTEGEPAQVLDCPACGAVLAVPGGRPEGGTDDSMPVRLHLAVTRDESEPLPEPMDLSTEFVKVLELEAHRGVLSLLVQATAGPLSPELIDEWWTGHAVRELGPVELLCVRASRPGYFVRSRNEKPWNFEIWCPAPGCPLEDVRWRESVPVTLEGERCGWQPVVPAFACEDDGSSAVRVPIPALTVDDQIYAWPPSLLVSTVDKFARIAFEPRAGALFGNVEHYHAWEGYYRQGCIRLGQGVHPPHAKLSVEAGGFAPPELVLQDELHLIDGPLGSMVGLYETVVEKLCSRVTPPKYIASTATVREAGDQVQALFRRELRQFPAPCLDASDSFFALIPPGDPGQTEGPGRLYLGFCACGRGALTPLVRLWAVILQAVEDMRREGVETEALDGYWTPVGYFNAIGQLARVTSLWRQSIPQWMSLLADPRRELNDPVELSSRVDSLRLPALLNRLERRYPQAPDGVLATSMFGTGVDVSRLSLMVVHGQPKTTSAYIQATGRVGRAGPGLIVTAYLAHRPRELNHYEYFVGYHLQLYRGVEPVTVFPFAPRARERGFGPLCVAWLRQQGDLPRAWRDTRQGPPLITTHRDSPEVAQLTTLFEDRAAAQPEARRPAGPLVRQEVDGALDCWKQLAESTEDLRYQEYTISQEPSRPVVLGDPQHLCAGLDVAFRNAPQSLREVEPTTGFRV